ncbi:hypothetical protein LSAT2_027247, partial [Lamellibrachia satsuma]
MPFGLKNAAQTFQRFMDHVFRDFPFAYVYLDDILVASASADEHHIHLRQLFSRLADYGLVVNPQKCVLGQPSLEFLGHCVTAFGVRPLLERVKHITDFPRPSSTKSLKEFLELSTATHVFVRVDVHRRPLQAPYQGPFKVVERHEKFYKLDLGTRHDTVSIDRLKPAFLE